VILQNCRTLFEQYHCCTYFTSMQSCHVSVDDREVESSRWSWPPPVYSFCSVSWRLVIYWCPQLNEGETDMLLIIMV